MEGIKTSRERSKPYPGVVLFDGFGVEQVRKSKKIVQKIPANLAARGDLRIKRRCQIYFTSPISPPSA
jgi:hypothetical protein